MSLVRGVSGFGFRGSVCVAAGVSVPHTVDDVNPALLSGPGRWELWYIPY